MKSPLLAFVVLAVSGCAKAATYTNTASIKGEAFLDAFYFQPLPDPTWGRVTYVNQSVAQEKGLYAYTDDTFTVSVDSKTVLTASGPGRDSFRLVSNHQYANHVAVFDVSHMPVGCGTWPAICEVCFALYIETFANKESIRSSREVGDNWPNGGEIDIVEGVNSVEPNQATIHTSGNCNMPASRSMTGSSVGPTCSPYGGCGVKFDDPKSFGPDFNTVGGGWFVIERSPTYIAMWFWERTNPCAPSEVVKPGKTIDTSNFGSPAAFFPNTDCDFASHFAPMNMVINCDLCGAWAGAVFTADGCPGNCVDYVNNNPGKFADAYFEFNALNIFE